MQKYCKNCGYTGSPQFYTPGGCLIELALWCFFLVPGIIYTLWRWSRTSRSKCPNCGQINTMIPLNSPAIKTPKQAESWIPEDKPEETEDPDQNITLPPRDEAGRFIIE